MKKELFVELDRIVKDGAILATNTSTLPVVEMAVETGRPERVVGVHFFNPAPAMSLVEIVRTLLSSDETMAEAVAFAEACGKGPVEVEDRAGFIVNALLFPYLNNAVRMLENGTASRDDIDAAMKGGCNFPMGPLALLDLVGLDTSRRHPRRPLRRVPRPELRGRAAAAPHGRRRPPRPEVGPRLLRLRRSSPVAQDLAVRSVAPATVPEAEQVDEARVVSMGDRRARRGRGGRRPRPGGGAGRVGTAGRAAVPSASGRWLADTVVEVAPRLPVRDAPTLSAITTG